MKSAMLLVAALPIISGCTDSPHPLAETRVDNAEPITGTQEPIATTPSATASGSFTNCTGFTALIGWPGPTGYPFPAPRGWEPSSRGAASFDIIVVSCQRIAFEGGLVFENATWGFELNGNISSDGKQMEGGYDRMGGALQLFWPNTTQVPHAWRDGAVIRPTGFTIETTANSITAELSSSAGVLRAESPFDSRDEPGPVADRKLRLVTDSQNDTYYDLIMQLRYEGFAPTCSIYSDGGYASSELPIGFGNQKVMQGCSYVAESDMQLVPGAAST